MGAVKKPSTKTKAAAATPPPAAPPAPAPAAAPKAVAAPKPAPVVVPAAPALPVFPKKELDAWLKAHNNWGHDEWLDLLATLKAKGHGYWTDSTEKANELGLYLESNRGKVR